MAICQRSGVIVCTFFVGIALLCTAFTLSCSDSPTPGRPAAAPATRPAQEAAYGLPARVPWIGSHVAGSPEAPPAYVVERLFPRITFKSPVDIAFAPGSDRVFILEVGGKIFSFPADGSAEKADLVIDLKSEVQGLEKVPDCKGVISAFGLAFHPRFAENHYCYVCYLLEHKTWPQNLPNGTRVSRFTMTGTSSPRLDPASEVVLLDWRGGGHNGGCLKFGPDGCLYISAGDSGEPNPPDPFNTGQNIGDLMSSILRIDVDHAAPGKAYSIPADNPFIATEGARAEVWAFGLRNPWRMSFDRATGELWAGDVGWELWEMVYRIRRGGNYGWSITEGPQPVHPEGKLGPTPIFKPELALSHAESASLTGGIVYRGKRLPELSGQYIFGDWETRRIWASKLNGQHLEPHRQIARTDLRVIAFGEDHEGELYVLDYEGGGVYRLAPNPEAGATGKFPTKLSETGLFISVARHEPAAGVLPFTINAEQWNDGATAERFIAVPGDAAVKLEDWKAVYPKNSVLVRTFSLPAPAGDHRASGRRRVETQLLHFDGKRWNGYTYRWNDAQTDANLVDAAGAETTYAVADAAATSGTRPQTWHFASRAQCATCHTSWGDYTLAYNLPQLDRTVDYGRTSDNQIRSLRHVGLLPPAAEARVVDGKTEPAPPPPQPLAGRHDATASLEARARSYLHVNCAHCHRFGGGGAALIDLRFEATLDAMHAAGVPPTLGDFDLPAPRIIAPGDPARSVLLFRTAKLGRGRMPHVGSYEVDADGVALLADWMRHMPAPASAAPTDVATAKRRTAEEADLAALQRAGGAAAPDASATIDRLLDSSSGALSLLLKIDAGETLPEIKEQVIARGAASAREGVRDLFERFIPPDKLIKRLGPTIDPAPLLTLIGDAARGQAVFFDAGGGLCRQCHQIAGKGNNFGPDLSHIGAKYGRAALLDNVLNPSKTIEPAYVTYVVRTAGGDDYVGLLREKTAAGIVLRDAQMQDVRIPTADIKIMSPQPTSSMPEGLLSGLTAQEAADLLAFLAGQK